MAWWLPQSSKLVRPDCVGLGGFDSHTLPPRALADDRPLDRMTPRSGNVRQHRAPRRLPAVLAALLAVSLGARAADAQVPDTTRGPRPTPTVVLPGANAKPPITPRRAFFYSLFAPGSGQSILNRPTAGSIFVSVEAGALVMIAKSRNDLRAARALARDSVISRITVDAKGDTTIVRRPAQGADRAASRIGPRRAFVEDWITILIVNHFLAGADAYVAANLWDVPADVTVSAAPQGGMLVGAKLRW